ncbi:MAG: ABC transporter permease [Gemmatimonadota bacterium]|nr:ABC transporter permease [Gemmatimonadota bacterium]MDH5616322.1 ABC transporter permease [Acidimicrobiia bacterium]
MSWNLVKEVAEREIRTRARTKSFRIITGILVAAAILGPIVSALWPEGGDDLRQVTVGLVDVEETTQQQIMAFAEGNLDVTFQDYTGLPPAQLDQALSDGDIDVAIEGGQTLVWDRETDFEIAGLLFSVLQQQEVLVRGRMLGLDEGDIVQLLTPVQVEERFADKPGESEGVATGVAFLGLMAAFILPQAFGQLTMMSVVEEKSTRVIEVLLGHLRPRALLLGKVLGIGTMAVGQLMVVVGGLTAALLLTNTVDIPSSVWHFVPIIVVSILGGLAIYNTFFALLGSLISRQEDAAQVIMPTLLPLMAGYLVGQSAVFGDAESALVKVLTLFPLTAPMLLPVRVARDAIAPWEIALSLGLLAVGVWLLIRIAGRVYEFTLLQTGSRIGWGQVVRLSRGAALD